VILYAAFFTGATALPHLTQKKKVSAHSIYYYIIFTGVTALPHLEK
jgi:hypothetical protein